MTLADGPANDVAADYDRVASAYAKHIYGELDGKPFDRELLDRFAHRVGGGRVCDAGCGPGHLTRYLRDRGCDAFGLDLSPAMVELARSLNSGVEFVVGDLRQIPVEQASLAGIVCFYSLIHLAGEDLAPALAALRSALRPGGQLLLAVHEGSQSIEPGELWGIPVALRFNFLTREQLEQALHVSAFAIDQITHRAPYPEVEVETNRLYATATARTTQAR
jgi:SAM-dependent methyltransferase